MRANSIKFYFTFFFILEDDQEIFATFLESKENEEKLIKEFKNCINKISKKNILDDFLQEYVIDVNVHEKLTLETDRDKSASLLFSSVKKSCSSVKLISILESHGVVDLAERLKQASIPKVKTG